MSAMKTIMLILAGIISFSTYSQKSTNSQREDWVEPLIRAMRSPQGSPSDSIADLLYKSATLMPKQDWEIYLLAATHYAQLENNDKAFEALQGAIGANLRDVELIESLPSIANLKKDSRWDGFVAQVESNRKRSIDSILDPNLLQELQQMWALDQATIAEFEEKRQDLSAEEHRQHFKKVEAVWTENQRRLDEVIAEKGWPGYKLVGEDGGKLSWAIAQHAPDIFFKEKCLKLIGKAARSGDADPNHFAELHDRIARDTWTKQSYGASMGGKQPYPIEDASNVDLRRFKLGLALPVEVYAIYHGIDYQVPSKKEAEETEKRARREAQESYSKFLESLSAEDYQVANDNIRQAISYHGDLSNSQLYEASVRLANTLNASSQLLSMNILKVLIYRRWSRRLNILKDDRLTQLHRREEWQSIPLLVESSRKS